MRFKMSQNSLFAILLRSPWWVSIITAVVVALLARLILPAYLAIYSVISGLPFLIIGAIAFYKQMRVPSTARVASTIEAVNAMNWRDFAAALEEGLRNDGYAVTRIDKGAADFSIYKEGRTALVCAKRWKAARHGIEPLRDLVAAREKQDAHEAVYVAAGELTDNARVYGTEHGVRLIGSMELARLLRGLKPAPKAAA
jgi:restriction system protein